MGTGRQSKKKQVRQASWLALVALACLQLTLASHQFEHAAEVLTDTCHICAQLDRLDDVVVDLPASINGPAAPKLEAIRARTGFNNSKPLRLFDSRGPPQL